MNKHLLLSCLIAASLYSVALPTYAQETLTGPMPIANPVAVEPQAPDNSANTASVSAIETVDDGVQIPEPSEQAAAAPAGDPGYTIPESFYESQNEGGGAVPAASSQASPAVKGESGRKKGKGWRPKKRASSSAPAEVAAVPEPAPEPAPAPMQVVTEPTPVPEPAPVVVQSAPEPAPTPVPEPMPNYSSPPAPAPVPEPAPASTALAGYDGGFFIKSADGKFSWNLVGRIQPRFSANVAEDLEDKYSFTVRRVLLVMYGNAVDPKLSYEIVMMPAVTPILVGATLGYSFMPEFNGLIGYHTIPSTHTAMESSGKFQLVDSSLATSKFGLGDSVGVTFNGAIGPHFAYNAGIFNGAATDLAKNQNNEMAYGLQLMFNVFGAYGGGESDLKDSQEPNWLIELDGNYHHEESGTQAKVIHGALFTGLKWHGLGLLAEGNIRYIDPDEFTREQIDMGYTLQAGYFLIPTKLEIAARHSALLDDTNDVGINQNMTAGNIGGLDGPHIGVDVGGDSDNEYEFSGAITYYFAGNNAKIQAQYSYVLDGIPGPDDETYHIGIIQGQVGF